MPLIPQADGRTLSGKQLHNTIRTGIETIFGEPGPIALARHAKQVLADAQATGDAELLAIGLRHLEGALQYAYPRLRSVELSGQVVAIPAPVEQGPPPIEVVADVADVADVVADQ